MVLYEHYAPLPPLLLRNPDTVDSAEQITKLLFVGQNYQKFSRNATEPFLILPNHMTCRKEDMKH